MKARPSHIWFVPIFLFGLSTLRWVAFTGFLAYFGELEWPLDYFGITHVYLPFLAALLGLSVAIVAARVLRRSVLRKNLCALTIYALTFLSWGVVDIRYFHYQAFHCGMHDGKSWEDYWTWYFIPYDFVPRYK
jgi:hypothetical protein